MKRAIVLLSEQVIEGMLRLPTGVHLRTVRDAWNLNSVQLMLEGDGLPSDCEYVPNTEPMHLPTHLELVDGKLVLEL